MNIINMKWPKYLLTNLGIIMRRNKVVESDAMHIMRIDLTRSNVSVFLYCHCGQKIS